jgi:hypothetical protein
MTRHLTLPPFILDLDAPCPHRERKRGAYSPIWTHHLSLIALPTRKNGQLNCDAYANSNTGCGVSFNQGNSFGPSFNNNGGGWFAMERNNNFIKVWFWPRNSGSVPSDLRNGAQTVNTDSWVRVVASCCCDASCLR